MKEGLSKARLPESIIVFRGVSHMIDIVPEFDPEHPERCVGGKIVDQAFLSTSLDKRVAYGFTSRSVGAIFEIKAPEGSEGVSTDHKSKHLNEAEFIFNHGHALEITGYRKDSEGYLIFETKLVKHETNTDEEWAEFDKELHNGVEKSDA